MPKVSIIVPNYNHAQYLPKRIESILQQTYQDFELILLDDCSPDTSREVLNAYKGNTKVTHIVLNEKNSGSTFKQWNKGIELARGKYIWIAESDDWADPMFLETCVSAFENNMNVGLVFTQSQLIDAEGNITYKNELNNSCQTISYSGKQFIKEKLTFTNSIWNASMMMFRKSLYPSASEQILYASMRYCGDWFFYVLLSTQNINVIQIKQTLNYYRIHNNNVSTAALANGITFLEGLDVLRYLKRNINYGLYWISVAKVWAKNLNRFKRHHNYSTDTLQKIVTKLSKEQSLIYFLYLFFEPYYIIKSKLK